MVIIGFAACDTTESVLVGVSVGTGVPCIKEVASSIMSWAHGSEIFLPSCAWTSLMNDCQSPAAIFESREAPRVGSLTHSCTSAMMSLLSSVGVSVGLAVLVAVPLGMRVAEAVLVGDAVKLGVSVAVDVLVAVSVEVGVFVEVLVGVVV